MIEFIFAIAILIMSIVIHEVSHGFAANALGDPTAKYAGRLTLNPIPHIDPIGSILLPLLLLIPALFGARPVVIGWAKPVPYNPYNLRNQRWGPAIVGAAGPLANIAIAVLFAFMLRFTLTAIPDSFAQIIISIVQINIWLALFNLIPIPPLDGSKVLFSILPARFLAYEAMLERYGFYILLIIIFILPNLVLEPLFNFALWVIHLLVGV